MAGHSSLRASKDKPTYTFANLDADALPATHTFTWGQHHADLIDLVADPDAMEEGRGRRRSRKGRSTSSSPASLWMYLSSST